MATAACYFNSHVIADMKAYSVLVYKVRTDSHRIRRSRKKPHVTHINQSNLHRQPGMSLRLSRWLHRHSNYYLSSLIYQNGQVHYQSLSVSNFFLEQNKKDSPRQYGKEQNDTGPQLSGVKRHPHSCMSVYIRTEKDVVTVWDWICDSAALSKRIEIFQQMVGIQRQ